MTGTPAGRRIALTTMGTRGDAQPMVVLGRELAARGHDVVLGVSPNLVEFVAQAGLPARPVGVDSQQVMESPQGQGWLASGNVRAFMNALGEISHANAATTFAQMRDVTAGADLIVAGVLTEDLACCLAEAQAVPFVALHSAPWRPTRAFANPLVTIRELPAPLNRGSGRLFERIAWRTYRQDVNQARAGLGLAPTRRSTPARVAASGSLELQAYHQAVVPGLRDYGPRRPLVGFLTPDAQTRTRLAEAELPAGLDAWLDAGEPPVYFGFGSMPVTDPAAALAMISSVTGALGQRAVVSAGWSRLTEAPGAVGCDDGDRVRLVGAVNHDALLPRCRAAVHHGGAGTTAASLGAGVPTVVCSVFADQPFWGARVERLGAGAHVRFANLNARTLDAALRTALVPDVGRRAARLGDQLRAHTSAAADAADHVLAAGLGL